MGASNHYSLKNIMESHSVVSPARSSNWEGASGTYTDWGHCPHPYKDYMEIHFLGQMMIMFQIFFHTFYHGGNA